MIIYNNVSSMVAIITIYKSLILQKRMKMTAHISQTELDEIFKKSQQDGSKLYSTVDSLHKFSQIIIGFIALIGVVAGFALMSNVTFLAGLISVPCAAAGFVLQYAIGGTATFSISQVLTAMLGTHFLIGIGEGVITALAVGAVMASRSDLVYGYKGTTHLLETRVNK